MGHKPHLPLEQTKMGASGFVDDTRTMAEALEDKEVEAAGSRRNARARVARLSGIPLSFLHTLRYRPPKTIAVDIFDRLCVATERKAAEQIRAAEHDLSTARARRPGIDHSALCEVEAALAKARALLWGKE